MKIKKIQTKIFKSKNIKHQNSQNEYLTLKTEPNKKLDISITNISSVQKKQVTFDLFFKLG